MTNQAGLFIREEAGLLAVFSTLVCFLVAGSSWLSAMTGWLVPITLFLWLFPIMLWLSFRVGYNRHDRAGHITLRPAHRTEDRIRP